MLVVMMAAGHRAYVECHDWMALRITSPETAAVAALANDEKRCIAARRLSRLKAESFRYFHEICFEDRTDLTACSDFSFSSSDSCCGKIAPSIVSPITVDQ